MPLLWCSESVISDSVCIERHNISQYDEVTKQIPPQITRRSILQISQINVRTRNLRIIADVTHEYRHASNSSDQNHSSYGLLNHTPSYNPKTKAQSVLSPFSLNSPCRRFPWCPWRGTASGPSAPHDRAPSSSWRATTSPWRASCGAACPGEGGGQEGRGRGEGTKGVGKKK